MASAEWLRTFVAVYRAGSVTDGAALRSLSQPAASQQLRSLERAVGTPVFVRTPHGTDPTRRGRELYAAVAELAATRWNSRGNCLLVVGATYPEELAEVRGIAGDMPFLVPGVGAQGADVRAAIEAGQSADGRGLIVSSSRSIIHASSGADFAAAARAATILLRDQINAGRRRDAAA